MSDAIAEAAVGRIELKFLDHQLVEIVHPGTIDAIEQIREAVRVERQFA
jgi:hypothetical protein